MRSSNLEILQSMSNGNLLLDAALDYVKRGLFIFPVHYITPDGSCSCGQDCTSPGKHPYTKNGCKDASNSQGRVQRWWQWYPDANIGIATGKDRGVCVLDVDGTDGVLSIEALGEKYGTLPDTWRATTGNGEHIYLKYPANASVSNSASAIGDHLDIRGDNGYVVAPPSNHASGLDYVWATGRSPADLDLPEMPDWLLDLATTGAQQQRADARTWDGEDIPESQRDVTLVSIGGRLRSQGLDQGEIEKELLRINAEHCQPPLAEKQVREKARSVCKYPKGKPSVARYNFDDDGNAERFAEQFGRDFKYCDDEKTWFTWDGRRWCRDKNRAVHERAKLTVKQMVQEAKEISDKEYRDAAQAWAKKSSNKPRRDAMLDFAKTELAFDHDGFDKDPWLVNIGNGTIDLSAVRRRKHKRTDNITQLSSVEFDRDAKCPRWTQFLNEVMDGDTEIVSFLKRAVGYTLLGENPEHCFFILYGKGSNGKTVFQDTLKALFGEYARTAQISTFLTQRDDGRPRDDIRRLAGARYIATSEVAEGRRLDESLVKQLTGGDTVTARALYSRYIEFKPTFKIWVSCNNVPTVVGMDEGIWRRIKLIPFNVCFKDKADMQPGDMEKDVNLQETLLDELPGILNWALAGYVEWQEQGLGTPPAVSAAVRDYQLDMDEIGQFLDDWFDIDQNGGTPCSLTYSKYLEWCEANAKEPLKKNWFGRKMKQKGYASKQIWESGVNIKWYEGITFKRAD